MAKTSQDVAFTPRQAKALSALLDGATIGAAADAAGVHRKTVSEWLKQPAFKQALADEQKAAIEGAARRLSALSNKAFAALESVFDDPDVPAAVKVQAFSAAMGHLFKLHEMTVLSDEITRLEDQVMKRNH